VGLVGLLLFCGLLVLALFPDWVAPHDPRERVGAPLEPPSAQFPLGTNDIGQDLLSELIWGTRASLWIGLTVALLAVFVGGITGLLSGYYPDSLGIFWMRLADLTLVLPFLPLVILLSAYLGPSRRNTILVLVLVSWAAPARLVRSRVLSLMREPYMEAARALGCKDRRILWKHVWPGVRSMVLLQLVLVANTSILAEASLSFLGLGDPSAKSWGTMLYFARMSGAFLGRAWQWWVLPAGLMITLSVLSLVLMGYGLEQKLEPQM
jgi:ABC-type dipeptide/oligopeptide/nickel transport system permease subunit